MARLRLALPAAPVALAIAALALAALALVALLPASASAGGMDYPDNGTEAVGRGGAFAVKADSGEALYYNPAGFARQPGLRLTLDSNFVLHHVKFQRTSPDAGGFVGTGTDRDLAPSGTPIGEPVENQAPVFVAPMFALSYGFDAGTLKGLTIAFGAYGPPEIGRYEYNAPKGPTTRADGLFDEDLDPAHQDPGAANRYMLVDSDFLIVYPTFAAAYQITEWLSLGLALQYVYADLGQRQVAWNYPSGKTRQADATQRACPSIERDLGQRPAPFQLCAYPNDQVVENTYWDAMATLDVQGEPTFTGIAGVIVGPFAGLSFGASVRPPIDMVAKGTLTTEESPMMKEFGVELEGDKATLELTMPMILRVGARYDLQPLLGRKADVELDYVMEGWSAFTDLTVTPEIKTKVTTPPGGLAPYEQDLPPIVVQKNWEDVHAIRLGGDVAVVEWLTGRAGYIYETNAIPSATAALDFPNFGDRHVVTLGAMVTPIPWLDVNVSYAHVFQPELVVTDSVVRQITTDAGQKGNVVGNGSYETSYDLFSVGVTARFSEIGAVAAATPSP